MQNKLLPWCVALGLMMTLALESVVAQTRAPGQIRATAIKGTVTVKSATGASASVANDQTLSQGSTVSTGHYSSAVLVFSNGAALTLGADTELAIDEFTQEKFDAGINPAKLKSEPSTSVTSLKLNSGTLTGNVKKLNYGKGSSFTVNTPVGAAGIRGTSFQLTYVVDADGKGSFSIVTTEGSIVVQGQAFAAPVDVAAGKEVKFTIDVDTTTGKIKGDPLSVIVVSASPAEVAAITAKLQEMIDTVTLPTDAGSTNNNDKTDTSDKGTTDIVTPPSTTPAAGTRTAT